MPTILTVQSQKDQKHSERCYQDQVKCEITIIHTIHAVQQRSQTPNKSIK